MKLFKDHFQAKLNNKIKKCNLCHLQGNPGPVLGYGGLDADVMFISDFPQRHEARTGVPFTGKAKTKMLETIKNNKLKKGDYYFTYLIKHTISNAKDINKLVPPRCLNNLLEEIEVINPRIICSMGFFVTMFLARAYKMNKENYILRNIHGNGIIIPKKKKLHKLIRPMRYLVPTWSPVVKKEIIKIHFKKDVQTIKTIRALYPLLFEGSLY